MNEQNLKQKTVSGIIWKFMERFLAQSITLLVSIVLARLLSPDDYAPISIVTIFFAFANILISSGLNTALMQKKNADKKDYSTVYTFEVIASFIIYLVLFFLAPFIAKIYVQPILIVLFRVMGLVLIINAIKSVLCAWISSHLQFKKFFFSTLGGTAVSAIVGVTMAVKGFGVWALVTQQLTNSIIDTAILYMTTGVRFELYIDKERFKSLFSFGSKIFAATLVSTLYDEISPLVIGIKYSSADLACYEKGRSFPSLINAAFNDSISAVVFPAMAKVQDKKQSILAFTRRFMKLSSYLIFPVMIGFLCVSDKFIIVVLSKKWIGASPYIKIFCICFLFNIIQNGNLQAIKAVGRSDIILKLEIIKKTIYFTVLIITIFISRSPIYIAAVSIFNTLISTIINTYPNRKLIGYSYKMQIADVLPNLCVALLMGGTVKIVGKLCICNDSLCLIIQILIGMLVYICFSIITKNKNLNYIIELLRQFIFKKEESV